MEQNLDTNSLPRDFNIALDWTIKDGNWVLDLYDLVIEKCSVFHNELFPDDEIPYDEELFNGEILTLVWKRIINSRTQYPIEDIETGVIEYQYYFLYLELEPDQFIEISDPILKRLPKVKSLDVKRVTDVIDDILKPIKLIIQSFRNVKLDSDLRVHKLVNVIEQLKLEKVKNDIDKPNSNSPRPILKVGKPPRFKDEKELRNAVKTITDYQKLNQTQLSIKLGFSGESGLRTTLERLEISFEELISQ